MVVGGGGLIFQGISLEIQHKTVSNFSNWRTAHLRVALLREEDE